MPLVLIIFLLLSFDLACSISVEVGNNRERTIEKTSEQEEKAVDPFEPNPQEEKVEIGLSGDSKNEETDDKEKSKKATKNGGSDKTTSENINAAKKKSDSLDPSNHECTGIPEELPVELAKVCSEENEFAEFFPRALEDICEKRKFVNMLHPNCGYPKRNEDSFFVIEGGRHQDKANWLNFYGMISVNLDTDIDGFWRMWTTEFADPEEFRKNFQTINNVRIKEVSQQSEEDYIHFSSFSGFVVPTHYEAQVAFRKLSDDFAVIYEFDIGRRRTVIESKFLVLLKNTEPGKASMVAIDHKIVNDLKLQAVSLPLAEDFLRERMERSSHNSRLIGP